MTELIKLKQDEQMQELLDLLEQMQTEVVQKDATIEELQTQLTESLKLSERLNNENKLENVQALKNDLKQAKDLLRKEKSRVSEANTMIGVVQDKMEKALEDKIFAEKNQKIVEVPIEKQVLYEKCRSCDQAILRKAKERYEQKYKKLDEKFKVRAASHDILFFGFVAYSLLVTVFTAIRTELFIRDVKTLFGMIWNGICTIADSIMFVARSVAQIGDRISNQIVAVVVYWLLFIIVIVIIVAALIAGIWFIFSKINKMYQQYCWDRISVIVATGSIALVTFFGNLIKQMLPVNLLAILLLVQVVYVTVRWYVKNCRAARGYY